MTHPQQSDAQLTPLKRAFLALEEMQQKLDAAQKAAKESAVKEGIAVIGLGCRFPGGADTPAAYWELLRRGGQAVTEPPPGRQAVVAGVGGSHRASWLQEPVDEFDPHFFGIAPREAHGMDPQQRLLLEVAWEALESACQAPDRLEGTRTGVYVGASANDYLHVYLKQAQPELFDGYYASGIAHSIVSGRLSYLLGLQGPSMTLDTACSSSLAAVHLAVQSLRSGETDMALAGGVNLMLAAEPGVRLEVGPDKEDQGLEGLVVFDSGVVSIRAFGGRELGEGRVYRIDFEGKSLVIAGCRARPAEIVSAARGTRSAASILAAGSPQLLQGPADSCLPVKDVLEAAGQARFDAILLSPGRWRRGGRCW